MLSFVLPVDHVKFVLQMTEIHSESPGQTIVLPEIVIEITGVGYNLTKIESFKIFFTGTAGIIPYNSVGNLVPARIGRSERILVRAACGGVVAHSSGTRFPLIGSACGGRNTIGSDGSRVGNSVVWKSVNSPPLQIKMES